MIRLEMWPIIVYICNAEVILRKYTIIVPLLHSLINKKASKWMASLQRHSQGAHTHQNAKILPVFCHCLQNNAVVGNTLKTLYSRCAKSAKCYVSG